jgi:hypothetical protein
MTVVAIARELWRHRLVVIVGALLVLVAQLTSVYRVGLGVPPTFDSRQYHVGIASGAVLIDSQSSQTVDLGGGEVKVDVGALSARAKLLANLLVTRPLRDEIAGAAGVSTTRLITQLSSTTEPGTPPSEATDVSVQPTDPDANIVSLQTSDTVPIITINAQAPSERTATQIVQSTVSTLRSYLDSIAASNAVPENRKLVMRALGKPTSATALRGPRKSHAALLFIVLMSLWCAAILAFSGLAKAWRSPASDEAWQRLGRSGDVLADPPSDPLADFEYEPAGPDGPASVGEGADDDLWLPPPADSSSRVA